MGIDPGTSRIGFGVIRGTGAPELVDCGLLSVPSSPAPHRHLHEISKGLDRLIRRHRPALIAVEKLYVAKNSKAALAIAQARGVILLSAEKHGIPLAEYAPTRVKKMVTGYGAANKKGVTLMVCRILRVPRIDGPDDVTDALAVAIAAAGEYRLRLRIPHNNNS
ncbi:MAG: crossover junction endodeoxyribonuclease RuvC [bacterium]|nr:crossover junction endodeoxyribonuclease RuvC [bacterium]